MKIARLVHRSVMFCTTHDSLERAAQLMWECDIGCLPVVDAQGHIAGMITDRDVCMAAYMQGTLLRAIQVADVMSKQVYSCHEDVEIDAIERVMRQHQIRRMPVIDDDSHPVGIISINDLARAASVGQLPASEVAFTLAAVSAPRSVLASLV
jgi:CBS domain-containing protein